MTGNWPRARAPFPTLLVLLISVSSCGGPPETEVLWDTYGIPHIFASSPEGLFKAQGWAQMRAHGDLILRLYGQARGRAAEYWGEEHLNSDVRVRTLSIPQLGERWVDAQDAQMSLYLRAFVEGMNEYADLHPEEIADEMKAVLPVEARDVMAHLLRAIHFTFVSGPNEVPARVQAGLMEEALSEPVAGSNAWAVAPSRSASGHAMLLANPHLPWGDLYTWHELQLVGPDFDAYGAALVGMPLLTVGFNDHLGWTHTVNQYDGSDVFELTLDGDGYTFDGQTRPFEIRVDTLRVLNPNGTAEERTLTVKRSVHGPVVGLEEGKAYALRVAGLDRPQVFRQYYDMLSATTLEEFEAAMSMLQMPMFTTMYADEAGHIMHLFNGLVPRRARWEESYWTGPIPGDTPETLWTEYHSYDELPRAADPESGWLQNANDHPWTTTFPRPETMDPSLYPAYMSRDFMHLRAHSSARLMLEDPSLTFQEMVDYKHSTRVEMADRLLDDLLPLIQERGGEKARRGAEVLEAWDRTTDARARGAVLFINWALALYAQTRGDLWDEDWDPARPMETPDGLADPDLALALLEAAVDSTAARHGALDVAFGEVYRVRRGDLDLPSNGHGDPLGVFRAAWYDGQQGAGVQELFGGDSFVLAVEFGDPIQARALLGYGNETQPHSPHTTDQLELFSEKRLRPVWRTREEVEAHLRSRMTLR